MTYSVIRFLDCVRSLLFIYYIKGVAYIRYIMSTGSPSSN